MHSIQDNYRTEARRAALNKVEESIFGGYISREVCTGLELSRRTDAYFRKVEANLGYRHAQVTVGHAHAKLAFSNSF